MSSTRFVEPKNKVTIKPKLSERLRRKTKAVELESEGTQVYIPNRTNDKAEIEVSLYVNNPKYKDNVRRSLLTIYRVKIPQPGQFEINENLDIDNDFKVKEALVYQVLTFADAPGSSPGTNVLAQCLTVHGVYQRPQVKITRDDLGNITSSDIVGWKHMFYIPFSEQTVRDVIEEHGGGKYRDLAITSARLIGDTWAGELRVVYNLQEFLTIDHYTLELSNKAGLLGEEYGGHARYLKQRKLKEEELARTVEEYSNVIPASKAKKQ